MVFLGPPPPQVPVIQVMLGQLGVFSSEQMFSAWRYVVVGATVAAAVLTPSTDPFTQVRCGLRRQVWPKEPWRGMSFMLCERSPLLSSWSYAILRAYSLCLWLGCTWEGRRLFGR